MAFLWRFLFVSSLTQLVSGCVCPPATVFSLFPSEVPAHVCCLNFSGSSFSHVRWSAFANQTDLETLDLSLCNISSIDSNASEASSALRRVYLGQNRLTSLPTEFLSGHSSLLEVDLSGNLLQQLPEDFLHHTDSLQKLDVHGNQLHFLPACILQKPDLQRLELGGNPWDCSCALVEVFQAGGSTNRTTRVQELVGNLTCSSPRHLAGWTVWSVKLNNVCRPAALTALFIVLPLIILSALLLCWCCGRKRRKDVPMLSTSKKRASGACSNGQKHFTRPPAAEQNHAGDSIKDGILKNQLLLRPASALLGSTRDIYEEVEVKLGSAESLPRASSLGSGSTEGRRDPQEPDGVSKTELDAVSVTDVMKDSADREKAYMTQSTEYYSLVPGIELEDSDHGEYENVDLS